jgi:hydroxymethylpyrimidine pyrophosphatase-like HAD family hydrolase
MLESFKILKKKIQFILAWIIDRNEHSLNISYLIIEKEFRRFLSKQIISFSSSMMIDNDQKFEIENIVDFRLMSRTFNKQLQYKIKWVEHFSDRKWYFVENFDHAKEIVVDYHHRYSHKSKQQLIIVSLIINQVMKINWIKQSMKNAQNLIQKTLNRMKKRKKMIKSSTFSVDRNFINIKTASQDCFVTKATSVERILSNQKKKKDSVTISCHSLSQMISIKKN